MTPLERTRLEKALSDHGFDLTPLFDGSWLVGHSTQHATVVWLHTGSDDSIIIAAAHNGIRMALKKEGIVCLEDSGLPSGAAWQCMAPNFKQFYRLLGRVAALARSLPNQVVQRFANATKTLPKSTEAERLVIQRIGQNLFREALIDYWQGRCSVTGLDIVSLLRASHTKPWAACVNDEERLDVFNGLLLAPHLDALFDGGWITFAENGEMQVSTRLSHHQRDLIGLASAPAKMALTQDHQAYMAYHREKVFM